MAKVIQYLILPIYKPCRQLDSLISDHNQMKYSSLILLIVGIMYTFSVAVAAIKGIHIVVKPFIPIPVNKYYFWEMFFTIPFFFVSIITFSGVARFLSSFFRGSGTFEKIFSVYATVTVLPLIVTMWIPETLLILSKDIDSNNPYIKIPFIIDISRQVLGIIWPLIYTVIGIRKIEQLSYWKCILVTIAAFIPYSILIITYIR